MNDPAEILILIGLLFLASLLTDLIGRHTCLPRITLLLVFGMIIGPAGFNFLSPNTGDWFSVITDITLIMIGFLLGGKFTVSSMRRYGKNVLCLSLGVVVTTLVIVFLGLIIIGVNIQMALILAAVATATDPAAVTDVIHETKANGPFAKILSGIVAIDDAWGLITFSLVLTIVQSYGGMAAEVSPIITGLWEIFGALLIGIGLGIPMSYLTGRIKDGEPTLIEAVGIVFLCGGLSLWLEVSYLLASMILGTVVINRGHHHKRPFHAIEGIEWPFLILFFIMAGASIRLDIMSMLGVTGVGYIVFRIIGRLVGTWIGGIMCNADIALRRFAGLALLPQAGVALGMALVASQKFPDLRDNLLSVVITSTVIFEIIGPLCTRFAIVRVGEAKNV